MFEHVCGQCRRRQVCRLGLTAERYAPDRQGIEVQLACAPLYEGAEGLAHGGWTAAVLDEALGHLAVDDYGFAVTQQLSVDYVKPVPVGQPLTVRARVDWRGNRRIYISGVLVLDATSEVLARGSGVWVGRHRSSHVQRAETWFTASTPLATPTEETGTRS